MEKTYSFQKTNTCRPARSYSVVLLKGCKTKLSHQSVVRWYLLIPDCATTQDKRKNSITPQMLRRQGMSTPCIQPSLTPWLSSVSSRLGASMSPSCGERLIGSVSRLHRTTQRYPSARFAFLTLVTMERTTSCYVTLYTLGEICWRFGGKYCFHFQGRRLSSSNKQAARYVY
jgi:hypothetical protein